MWRRLSQVFGLLFKKSEIWMAKTRYICRAQLLILLSLSPLVADEISDDIRRRSAVNFFALLQLLSAKPTNVEAQPTSWRLTFAKREAVAKDFLEAIIYTSRLFEKKCIFRSHSKHIIVISHQACKTGSPPCCGWQSKEGIGCEDFSESISSERITGSQLQGKLHSVTQLFQISQFVSFSAKTIGCLVSWKVVVPKKWCPRGKSIKIQSTHHEMPLVSGIDWNLETLRNYYQTSIFEKICKICI